MSPIVSDFSGFLGEEKKKFSLLLIRKNVHFLGGFLNNFHTHRRLSEQLLEPQAGIRKLEQAH
jgi:hypothetical protein